MTSVSVTATFLAAGLAVAVSSRPVLTSQRAPQAAGTDENETLAKASFELVQSHVVIALDLNGAGQEQFIVDSGAEAVLLNSRAAESAGLKLARRAHKNMVGNGDDKAESFSVKSVSLQLGREQIFSGTAYAADLGSLSNALGDPIAGVVGRPFFEKYVVEIDYSQRVLRLYDPRYYRYQETGNVLPIQVKGVPLIDAWIGEPSGKRIKAKLEIDTGSDSALILSRPFELVNYLPWPGQVTVPHFSNGIGGDFRNVEGRVDSLRIATIEIDKPLVIFSEADTGLTSTRKYDGSIGGDILSRFTIVFDYPQKIVILKPNDLFGSPFQTGTEVSGLVFGSTTSTGPDGTVTGSLSTIKGSAAALAGFQEGDKIIAIDGKRSSEYTRREMERIFSQEGATIHLQIERAGKELEVTVRTPRLL
jgi:Aspartyl protease/PDZ domain